MPDIADTRILILATDGFEDSELFEPRKRLIDEGAEVVLASPDGDEIKGDKGGTIKPDKTLDDVDAGDFDALVLPGGTKNPDKLRMDERAVRLVRTFFDARKPVGAICHAPWLLVEADVVRGRTVTSWPSVRTDLRNAGAAVVDQEAAIDDNLVTSRKPEDIPAFCDAFIGIVEGARAELAGV
jgi:protease I